MATNFLTWLFFSKGGFISERFFLQKFAKSLSWTYFPQVDSDQDSYLAHFFKSGELSEIKPLLLKKYIVKIQRQEMRIFLQIWF